MLADQVIHIHLTPPAEPSETEEDDALKVMLASASASPHLRGAADGLRALGYELRPPGVRKQGKPREKYLRIMDPAYTAHGVGYLTLTAVDFTRGMDREPLAALPGARVSEREVRFALADGVEQPLHAAKLIKG